METILATDIGGTNSRFAFFRRISPRQQGELPVQLLCEHWFSSAEFAGFPELLAYALSFFRAHHPEVCNGENSLELMVIAAAGPLVGGNCTLPNLSWTISPQQARLHVGSVPVLLVNDFAAQGHACLYPEAIAGLPLLAGKAVPGAPVALLGAGTGLGKALVLPGPAPRILASEGGHNEFPFVGREEEEFAAFLREATGTDNLIGDMVLSGSGLAALFTYHSGIPASPAEAVAQITHCPEALAWFARFYGRACRHFVLDTMALGGLYITGGMALRVPVLNHPAFAASFTRSAHHHNILQSIPVWHVQNHQAGLFGAAIYGALYLQEHPAGRA